MVVVTPLDLQLCVIVTGVVCYLNPQSAMSVVCEVKIPAQTTCHISTNRVIIILGILGCMSFEASIFLL